MSKPDSREGWNPVPLGVAVGEDPRTMARALGVLFFIGAALGVLSLAIPHPTQFEDWALVSNIALAMGGGAVLFATAGRLPSWVLQLVVAFGTLAITRAIYYSHEPNAYYSIFYLWVALYSFYYFGRVWGLVQMVLVGGAYAWVLSQVPTSSPAGLWVINIVTLTTAGFLVNALARRLRERDAESAALLARLEQAVRTDDLTGLPNRRAWDEHLARELARASRVGSSLCVAMLDLDHFKQYNDRNGHQGGDRFLKEAAAAWQERIRESDLIARYGGEEFAIALLDCDLARATEMVDQMREETPEGESSSVGVAAWDGEESGADLVARADAALYAAKRAGRDKVIAA